MHENAFSRLIIGAAIEVHRQLGPGLFESAYEECLAYEFSDLKIPFERQKPLPLFYKGKRLDGGFRLDFLVGGMVVVELKAVDQVIPVHATQMLTYFEINTLQAGSASKFQCSQTCLWH